MDNHSYIIKEVKSIQKEMKNGKSVEELSVQFMEFKEKYPKTWMHIIEGNFSTIEFNKMNEVYQTVYNLKEGEHLDRKNIANVAIGNHLAEKFLYPITGKPSMEDMQKGYTQVLEKNKMVKENTNTNTNTNINTNTKEE